MRIRRQPAPTQREDTALVLFTLAPDAEGRRKTLGPSRRAAEIFALLLEHLRDVGSRLAGVDLLLATPAGSLPGPGERLVQRGNSFGDSLRMAVDDAFALGYRRVLLIGNDAPEISRNYLRRALGALGSGDRPRAVLGPAADGGYVLLGLNAPCAAAFRGIGWGGSRVARDTERRLSASGFDVERLPTIEDIDDAFALARFLSRSRATALALLARRMQPACVASLVRDRHAAPAFDRASFAHAHGLRAPPPAA